MSKKALASHLSSNMNSANLPHHARPTPATHPYQLGASLYMPATRGDIWQVINRSKLAQINSVIICLEDAVSEADVPMALNNLQHLLTQWHDSNNADNTITGDTITDNTIIGETTETKKQATGANHSNRPLVFIRPRHALMLKNLADMRHIDLVDGFVLPKVDIHSLSDWRMACQFLNDNHLLMPTLETRAVFDPIHNQELAVALTHAFDKQVFALRIGGNDLFAVLRQRRPKNSSVYGTAIGTLIYELLGCFVPHGFYLTAPVFEYLDAPTLFMQELTQDVALGLVGKTVIHPSQIALVQQAFCVPASTFAEATAILDSEAKAVFKYNNTMLEPATHSAWANEIIKRAQVFGVAGEVATFG